MPRTQLIVLSGSVPADSFIGSVLTGSTSPLRSCATWLCCCASVSSTMTPESKRRVSLNLPLRRSSTSNPETRTYAAPARPPGGLVRSTQTRTNLRLEVIIAHIIRHLENTLSKISLATRREVALHNRIRDRHFPETRGRSDQADHALYRRRRSGARVDVRSGQWCFS